MSDKRIDYLVGSGRYTPVQARILLQDLDILDPVRQVRQSRHPLSTHHHTCLAPVEPCTCPPPYVVPPFKPHG